MRTLHMTGDPKKDVERDAKLVGEEDVYEYRSVQWKAYFTKAKYIPHWIAIIVIIGLTVAVTIYKDQIIAAIRPTAATIRDTPAGFLIPVAILVIISFPPLFGHEIIALLCGVVYGLWIGFAIVAAGTFLGEIGTWFAFKYAFRNKAVKLERTNLNYGALARVTRDGGFVVVLIIRFSVIPSHFSTAVFSTCNVKFWHFAISTFLTLPKQIILVYVGVLLVQESTNNTVNTVVLFLTFMVTLVAAVYIYKKMSKTKKVLLAEQAARIEKRKNASTEELDLGQESPPENNLWQRDYVQQPRPARMSEGIAFEMDDRRRIHEVEYELEEARRPNTKPAEFI